MSKILSKFVQDYSLETLRDVDFSSLSSDQYVRYNGTDWENSPVPVFGKDKAFKQKENLETNGGTPVAYDSLTFAVTAPSGANTYRINVNFFWSLDSTSKDGIINLVVNGNIVRTIQVEPKDRGNDQRIPGSFLFYTQNLNAGNNTIEIRFGSSRNNVDCFMHSSLIEVWRFS